MMIASEKKIGAADLLRRGDDARRWLPRRAATRGRPSSGSERCRYAFSTITIEASTRSPIASAMPPSDMMFERDAEVVHRDERRDDGDRQRRGSGRAPSGSGTGRRGSTSETTIASSISVSRSVPIESLDQAGPVVGRHDPHARRQRRLHLAQLRLDAVDHAQRVLAEAHDDDAADDLALAVELGDAAADVGADAARARRRRRGSACRARSRRATTCSMSAIDFR